MLAWMAGRLLAIMADWSRQAFGSYIAHHQPEEEISLTGAHVPKCANLGTRVPKRIHSFHSGACFVCIQLCCPATGCAMSPKKRKQSQASIYQNGHMTSRHNYVSCLRQNIFVCLAIKFLRVTISQIKQVVVELSEKCLKPGDAAV